MKSGSSNVPPANGTDHGMARLERAVYGALVCSVLIYLIVRAVAVPITHDEARTYFIYVLSGDLLPWKSYWDAGNHVVCSALGWVSYHLTGMSPISLRAGNLVAFVLYAFYAWKLGSRVDRALIRWCMWGALLLVPSFIEFFGLFRGYGLAFGFMLMAIHHQQEFVERSKMTDLVMALVGWLLAGWSMLSLSLIWCFAIVHLAAISFSANVSSRQRVKFVIVHVLLGLAPLVAGIMYGQELRVRGALYDGTEEGLFNGTYRLLLNTLFSVVDGPYFTGSLALLTVAALVAVVRLVQGVRTNWNTILTLVAALLAAEFIGRTMLWHFAGVRYPMGRTALHWVPMIILIIAFASDEIAQRSWLNQALALPLLILPLRTIMTLNMTHASVWPVDAIPLSLMRTMAAEQERIGRPLLIDGDAQLYTHWDFIRQWKEFDLPPVSSRGFPQPFCDLLLLDPLGHVPPDGFTQIAASENGRQLLYRRDRPLSLVHLGDTSITRSRTTDEFIDLPWPNGPLALRDNSTLELSLVVLSPERSLTARLVIDVADSAKNQLHYEALELRQLQRRWVGDTLHYMRRVPPVDLLQATASVYIWNPDRLELEVGPSRISSYALRKE